MDYLRNDRQSTSVAAFSTRASAGAPVSLPLNWRDLAAADLREDHFNVRCVPDRVGTPWRAFGRVLCPPAETASPRLRPDNWCENDQYGVFLRPACVNRAIPIRPARRPKQPLLDSAIPSNGTAAASIASRINLLYVHRLGNIIDRIVERFC